MALHNVLLFVADSTPPDLLPARQQMAMMLGFHIVLASFGLAFPALIFVMHFCGAIRGDSVALEIAHRWAKVAGVMFAIGAVSGTGLSFEMGLLWPGLMGRFGDVIGLPFGLVGMSVAYIPPTAGAVALGFAIPGAIDVDVADQLLPSGPPATRISVFSPPP